MVLKWRSLRQNDKIARAKSPAGTDEGKEPQMRISRIIVSGLFDRFNHDLTFKSEDRITIMIAPNGFGKTMILRIVNALFAQPIRALARMPFRVVSVEFDDASRLQVFRSTHNIEGDNRYEVRLTYTYPLGVEQSFVPEPKINPRDIGIPIGSIEDVIPALDQIGSEQWRDRRTGETLTLEDVLERFGHELPLAEAESSNLPKWLQDIRRAIPVRFIDTERLTNPMTYSARAARYRHMPLPVTARTVRRYSEELAERVRKTTTEYGSLAQSLDRTFPVRLVAEPSQTDLTIDTLKKELAEVESKRSKLVEAGLLATESEGWGTTPALDKVDESRRGVLAVYARDAQKKLSVFDDLYARVDTLKRVANARLLHKRVAVSADGLSVTAANGSKLELEMLSSGEQHELVILYELLFRVPRNAFILIDEPELSLHVAWQEQFLNDLTEITELSQFRVLLATHSPQIIGDRWDLTVELKGPEDQ